MAMTKLEASHIAQAAARGVALALTLRAQESEQEEWYVPPHLVCGYPPYIFETVLQASADKTVTVGPTTEVKTGG